MATLQELLEQKAAIDRAIASAQRESRQSAIAKIRELMAQNGLTTADLASSVTSVKRAKDGSVKKPVAAKYRDANGNQWSGRGLKPKWLTAALAQGKTLEDFAV